MQRHEAYEADRLSRIALENLMASEVFALDRIASPAKKLMALNSAGVALRAGTQRVCKIISGVHLALAESHLRHVLLIRCVNGRPSLRRSLLSIHNVTMSIIQAILARNVLP